MQALTNSKIMNQDASLPKQLIDNENDIECGENNKKTKKINGHYFFLFYGTLE